MNIGWTARNLMLDLFPIVSNKLRDLGCAHNSFYVCHQSLEESVLKREYNVSCPWVLAKYLRENWHLFEVTEDIVRELEKTYTFPPLIRCLWPDMFELKLSEETRLKNLYGHIRFWEDFLTNNNINVLVCERPSILATNVAWMVCKKLNITFLSFIWVPVGERMLVSETWHGHYDGLREMLANENIDTSSKLYKDSVAYVSSVKEKLKKSTEAVINTAISKERAKFPFKQGVNYILNFSKKYRESKKHSEYYINISIWQTIAKRLGMYINHVLYNITKIYDYDEEIKQRYFLFPLQSRNEWSNYAWMGINSGDIITLIKRITYCLPLGSILVVKEHTGTFGQNSIGFLKKIKKLNNVKLVGPFVDAERLILGAEAVITLGSTMGFEAVMKDKPAIVLGDPWYLDLKGVYRTEQAEDLAELLQSAGKLPVASDKEKIAYVYGLMSVSFDAVGVSHEKTFHEENLEQLARGVMNKIQNKKFFHNVNRK